jgi:hypothetical protein
MKTWKVEMLVVAIILVAINFFTNRLFTIEILAMVAVLLSFGHAQIANRLIEQEALRDQPTVECYKRMHYYFVGKECFWLLYFFMSQSYSALAGVFLFIAYPIWRKWWRKIKPL